jgi:hypothetical protein
MTVVIYIKGKSHRFATLGPSGYIYTVGPGGFLTRQLFGADGNALTASTEAELRKVGRDWMRRQARAEASL